MNKTPQMRDRGVPLKNPEAMINNDLSPRRALKCYYKTWPADKCERCRWMWECISHHEAVQDGR